MTENIEVISAYTREQALEDGVLVDVSEMAREAGFKFSTAVTARVWAEVVSPDEDAFKGGESVSGRLWDVMSVFWAAANSSKGSEVRFTVAATQKEKLVDHKLKALCHPGDHGEPVLTVMFVDED